jgi:hypothetical protein
MSRFLRRPSSAAPKYGRGLVAGAAAVAAGLTAIGTGGGAQALTIHPVYDASITSRSNAAAIESAFNTVAGVYGSSFSNKATINVGVSWGKVNGQAMGAGTLGSSLDNMYGYFTYGQVKGYLTTVAGGNAANTALKTALSSLPAAAPAGMANYAISSAEAKALGLIPGGQVSPDGYIGFNGSSVFDFDPTDGVAAGAYDFQAVAAHELDEVLGRITGLQSASPAYRTPLDLFRYSAPGVLSFSYNTPTYFSIDGGATRMGDFNYTGGGDRGDWLSSTTGLTDIQSAYLSAGKRYNLSVADLTALDVLGWGGSNLGDTNMWSPTMAARSFIGASVPEPGAWILMILGAAAIGQQLRQRQRMAPARVRSR